MAEDDVEFDGADEAVTVDGASEARAAALGEVRQQGGE